MYVGISAESIIPAKTIEIAGWGSEGDENKIKLNNLQGLHLVNVVVLPHYKNKLKKELIAFKKK